VLTPPAIVFKGSGWYKTDSRGSEPVSSGSSASSTSTSTTEAKSDTKTDAKTETKSTTTEAAAAN
jgi:predicted nucleic acid-binding Zn ribbon protein